MRREHLPTGIRHKDMILLSFSEIDGMKVLVSFGKGFSQVSGEKVFVFGKKLRLKIFWFVLFKNHYNFVSDFR